VKVPFTTADFLDRAAAVYPSRSGVVDEPGDHQDGGLGTLTYGRLAERAAALAAGLDELGLAPGDRVAVVSHNSARLLELFFGVTAWGRVLVPVNFRLSRDEVAYIVEHCGARVLLVDPEVDAALADVTAEHRFVLGQASTRRWSAGGRAGAVGRPDEDATATHQLHSGDDGPAQGRADHPPQHLGQRRHLRAARGCRRPRRLPAHRWPMFHANGWGMPSR
jgi:acyl-CoA synthetase (AMP-forming)/AMP-acid ligase II